MHGDDWRWLRWTNGGQIEKNEREKERATGQRGKTNKKQEPWSLNPIAMAHWVCVIFPMLLSLQQKKKANH